MTACLELISKLERTPITKEVLEVRTELDVPLVTHVFPPYLLTTSVLTPPRQGHNYG